VRVATQSGQAYNQGEEEAPISRVEGDIEKNAPLGEWNGMVHEGLEGVAT